MNKIIIKKSNNILKIKLILFLIYQYKILNKLFKLITCK